MVTKSLASVLALFNTPKPYGDHFEALSVGAPPPGHGNDGGRSTAHTERPLPTLPSSLDNVGLTTASQDLADALRPVTCAASDLSEAQWAPLVFLLQRGFLRHLHTYIYLIIPGTMKRDTDQSRVRTFPDTDGVEAQFPSSSDHSSLIARPYDPSPLEWEWIKRCGKSFARQDMQHLFLRLYRYFDGTWHIDEIICLEKISKNDMNELLHAASNVLFLSVR